MINYLNQLNNPQFNHLAFFEVMRDFRKGGLRPDNFDEFWKLVEALPPINLRTEADYQKFEKLGLSDVLPSDFSPIMREVIKRAIEKSKKCWHPLASLATCKVDGSGNIIVSAAHSIQNNGVLSQVAKAGVVTTYSVEVGEFAAKKIHKNAASIFWGFCNTHDAIFNPIETVPYTGTKQQHFLFAYRGFVAAFHKKLEVSNFMNYGPQAENDTKETKKLFDDAILANDFDCIETSVIELPAFYPIAVSSSFYLDFDFEENPIAHSDARMEFVYVTLLPNINRTYFIISHFKTDSALYGQLGTQLVKRNKLKSDISVLLAAHVENIYYNPDYFDAFIEKQSKEFEKLSFEAQIDFATVDDNDEHANIVSITPQNYLDNQYEISLFGY